VLILGHKHLHLVFDDEKLATDGRNRSGIVFFQEQQLEDFLSVFCRCPVLDERLPGKVQLLEASKFFAWDRACVRLQGHAHTGQHCGIGAVGLGQLAGRLGEAPCLAGADLGERRPAIARACSLARW
jgi:hypothetical protein